MHLRSGRHSAEFGSARPCARDRTCARARARTRGRVRRKGTRGRVQGNTVHTPQQVSR
jgi:hypothetical protein